MCTCIKDRIRAAEQSLPPSSAKPLKDLERVELLPVMVNDRQDFNLARTYTIMRYCGTTAKGERVCVDVASVNKFCPFCGSLYM